MNGNNKNTLRKVLAISMVLSIVLICFLTYKNILSYFFTACDTFTLIDKSRVYDWEDLIRILSEPMMNGTSFIDTYAKYYRPISVLTYSLDYSIWGMDAYGYHLTNLILYTIVTILIFILVHKLTKRNLIISWLSAVLFSTHPILIESVPAIARRQENLANLFIISSLLIYLKNISQSSQNKLILTISVLFYVIGLGCHEITFILPVLIFTHMMIYSNQEIKTYSAKVAIALLKCIPYLIVTLVYLLWRTYVLKDLGGSIARDQPSQIMIEYISDLIYPNDYLELRYQITNINIVAFIIVTIAIFIITLLVSLYKCKYIRQYFMVLTSSDSRKLAVLLLKWLLLPLTVFLLTRTYSHRNIYTAVIPFSILVSVIIVESFRIVVRKIILNNDNIKLPLMVNLAFIVIFFISVGLAISLFVLSPIFKDYGEWKDNGCISAMFVERLKENIDKIPTTSTINIYNLPQFTLKYKKAIPRVKTVSYLNDYSIKSWLDLNYPKNQMKVVLHNQVELSKIPYEIDFEIRIDKENSTNLNIRAKGDSDK